MATISPTAETRGGMCHKVTLVDYTRVRSVTLPLTLGKQPQASLLTWVSVLFFWVDSSTN